MTDSFSIRLATASDAPVLAGHRAGMFRDMGELPEPLAPALVDATRRYFEEAIPTGEYVGWVAFPRGSLHRIIAGAGVQIRRVLPRPHPAGQDLATGPQGLILNVYTDPAWRRRGIATALLQGILDWAATNEIKSLVLHASRDGRPLYEKLGFTQTNEMRYWGKPK